MKIGGAKPDIWFEPKVVWEVLTADLSLSPIYEAARGLVSIGVGSRCGSLVTDFGSQVDDRGISLRFPRFIRVRDDKAADDATEPSQVRFTLFIVLWVLEEAKRGLRLLRCTSDNHWLKVDQGRRRRVLQRTTFGNFCCDTND